MVEGKDELAASVSVVLDSKEVKGLKRLARKLNGFVLSSEWCLSYRV